MTGAAIRAVETGIVRCGLNGSFRPYLGGTHDTRVAAGRSRTAAAVHLSHLRGRSRPIALIYDDRDPTTTLAWILLLWALPGFGLILYFFAGRNWASKTRKGKVLHDYLAIRTPFMKPIYERYAEQAEKLRASMAHRFQGRVISAIDQMNDTALLPVVSVDVWPHGSTYFPELIADIRQRREVRAHAVLHLGARRAHRGGL